LPAERVFAYDSAMENALHIVDGQTRAEMLAQLRMLARDGETIISLGAPPPRAVESLRISPTHCPLASPRLGGWWIRNLANEVTLLHAWSSRAAQAARTLAYVRGVRAIYSLPSAPRGDELKSLIRLICKSGVHVTVPTKASREVLLRAGAAEGFVHVLPPAAESLNHRETRRRRVRDTLEITEEQALLVVPAEMVRGAGHKYASWSHAILRQILPHVRLLFPGGGPAEANVRYFASTTGYNDEVFFTGDRFETADVLAAGDVGVMFCERDCGVSALVAMMAASLPIAAARTPDLSECAPHEQAALLAEPKDPRASSAVLLRLLEDADLRARLGQAAEQRATSLFTPERARKELDGIYEKVLFAEPA